MFYRLNYGCFLRVPDTIQGIYTPLRREPSIWQSLLRFPFFQSCSAHTIFSTAKTKDSIKVIYLCVYVLISFVWYIYFIAGKVIITTLPPISTKGLTIDNMDELINETRSKMSEIFHASSKEVKDELLKPLAQN